MATQDTRNSYKIRCNIDVETCKSGEWTFHQVAHAERCSSGKFSATEAKERITKLSQHNLREVLELLQIHIDEILEKEAVLRAKEEVGESC